MPEYKVISLFSGCGGLDLGFRGGFRYLDRDYKANNFEIVWANDVDRHACRTYESYFNHPIVCGDVRDILAGGARAPADASLPEEADVVTGGFPCQDFSHAGKRRGMKSKRGTLYRAMVTVVAGTRPYMFVAENVKGLLTMNNGDAIRCIVKDFSVLGYNVTYRLLRTSDFGVPQHRERVIIIGTRGDILAPFDFACMTPSVDTHVTLGEAIGDLEYAAEGSMYNHYWSKAAKNKGQGNGTVSRDKPGPTMRAEHHGNIEFHWNGTRRLSAREAARIQSFPDDMRFYPSTSSAYRQIGNAVPPVFAWHLAGAVEKFMDVNLST